MTANNAALQEGWDCPLANLLCSAVGGLQPVGQDATCGPHPAPAVHAEVRRGAAGGMPCGDKSRRDAHRGGGDRDLAGTQRPRPRAACKLTCTKSCRWPATKCATSNTWRQISVWRGDLTANRELRKPAASLESLARRYLEPDDRISAGGRRHPPDRRRSEASFAALRGVCPALTPSGTSVRQSLIRGGDRAAYCASHIIAIRRLRLDPRPQDHAARRIAAGNSKLEAIRGPNRTSPAKTSAISCAGTARSIRAKLPLDALKGVKRLADRQMARPSRSAADRVAPPDLGNREAAGRAASPAPGAEIIAFHSAEPRL